MCNDVAVYVFLSIYIGMALLPFVSIAAGLWIFKRTETAEIRWWIYPAAFGVSLFAYPGTLPVLAFCLYDLTHFSLHPDIEQLWMHLGYWAVCLWIAWFYLACRGGIRFHYKRCRNTGLALLAALIILTEPFNVFMFWCAQEGYFDDIDAVAVAESISPDQQYRLMLAVTRSGHANNLYVYRARNFGLYEELQRLSTYSQQFAVRWSPDSSRFVIYDCTIMTPVLGFDMNAGVGHEYDSRVYYNDPTNSTPDPRVCEEANRFLVHED